MSSTPREAAGLKAEYAARLGADLEQNTREQERIVAEIRSLQDQLDVLKGNRTLLAGMLDALGGTVVGTQAPTALTDTKTETPSRTTTTRKTRPQKTTARRTQAAAPKRSGGEPKGTRLRTLGDLIREYLTREAEPRSAAEVTTALAHDHPERKAKATVVRATLEGQVAKGLIHRIRQGKSIYYSPAAAEAEEATSASAD
ncbi:hypothetical protein ACFVTC_19090 [Streptomyces sp. NPDC057950]|uniref:hypothetical protein n=1 Tax=Streptomyces sp. NPDC057950 TaxID=3346288 RepID=UPI0036EF5C79